VIFSSLGSNVIVAGTAIFGAEDPERVIKQLKEAVNVAQARFTETDM
jgi:ribulose-phosphate 3-epimerase